VRACTASAREVVPGFLRLVDDPDAHAHLRQPEGKNQPRRPGANSENIGFGVDGCGHAAVAFFLF
jgi:hypothetical protein